MILNKPIAIRPETVESLRRQIQAIKDLIMSNGMSEEEFLAKHAQIRKEMNIDNEEKQ